MMGPAWANWTVLNPRWPDSWPDDLQAIYMAFVSVDAQGNMKEVLENPIPCVCPVTDWFVKSLVDKVTTRYGNEAVILWQPVPPSPRLPKCWRLLQNVRCENHSCEYYDNSYCMNGPEDCPHGIPNQEFSAIF